MNLQKISDRNLNRISFKKETKTFRITINPFMIFSKLLFFRIPNWQIVPLIRLYVSSSIIDWWHAIRLSFFFSKKKKKRNPGGRFELWIIIVYTLDRTWAIARGACTFTHTWAMQTQTAAKINRYPRMYYWIAWGGCQNHFCVPAPLSSVWKRYYSDWNDTVCHLASLLLANKD